MYTIYMYVCIIYNVILYYKNYPISLTEKLSNNFRNIMLQRNKFLINDCKNVSRMIKYFIRNKKLIHQLKKALIYQP